ncbi:MAG: UDP-N-acetyl-D-glucosamine dehydrogenase [Syntrophus sp. (in: bacteria)]|nr:UDP-N-acetyl-D-glucosamine dehydrogenase [Syntrophus sp. (in: bacteria)]
MPLKIAVIGLGHMGRIHLNKLNTFDDVVISAIVDTDSTAAAELSKLTGAEVYGDYHDAIASCNGAVIATPTETHGSVGKAFLDAGKHVFMEKPITANPAEAEELVDIAKKNKLIFQIGHLERFNPAFLQALPLIQKPILIEATRISPFTGRSTDVDVVLDLMIHDLDLVLSLVRSEIRDVSAQGVCFMTDKLDAAAARIEFTDGCAATVTASRISPKKERSITIYEEDKSLSIDLLQGKLISIIKNNHGTADTKEYAATRIDPVADELREFVNAMAGGKPPVVQGIDGIKALLLAVRIKEFIKDKQRASKIQ